MRCRLVAVTVAGLSLLAAEVCAQQIIVLPDGTVRRVGRGPRMPASAPEDLGIGEGGVVVRDSFAAQDAIAQADLAVNAKDWAAAARAYQKIIDSYGDFLLVTGPRERQPIARVLTARVLGWPAEGRAAYEKLAEPLAAKALADATASGDVSALVAVGTRYLPAPSGAAALDRAADLLADGGDPAAGAVLLGRLRGHPHADAPRVLARLALWQTWAGRAGAAAQALADLERAQPAPDLLARVRAGAGQPPPASQPVTAWGLYGGDATRTGVVETSAEAGQAIWTVNFRNLVLPRRGEDGAGLEQAVNSGMFLNSLPVAAGGLVYVQDPLQVRAYGENSGSLVWEAALRAPGEPNEAGPRGVDSSQFTLQMLAPTVADGRLYAAVGRAMRGYWMYGRTSPPTVTLTCRDARTGRELWSVSGAAAGDGTDPLRDLTFDPSPLVLDGKLYAVGRRSQASGGEDVFLVCLDALTGQYRWSVLVCSAPLMRSYGSTQTFLAADAGLILVVTHAGVVAALDARSGQVGWMRLYARRGMQDYDAYEYQSRMFGWRISAPAVVDGKLIALPDDSDNLLVFDVADGKVLETIPTSKLDGLRQIVGVRGTVLFGLGTSSVLAYDLAQRKMLWTARLGAELFGRPCLTSRGIYVPTRTQLLLYGLNGGVPTRYGPLRPPEQMGHVVALPGQILVAGWSVLSSYARWEDIRQRFEQAVTARPADPAPRLDLAEVALRAGPERFAYALEKLDEAAALAGGWDALRPPDLAGRIFATCLAFAEEFAAGGTARAAQATELFDRAYRAAPDPAARVRLLLAYSRFLEGRGQISAAVARLQEVLATAALRSVMVARPRGKDDQAAGESQAGRQAQATIARLIERHGRGVYAGVEEQAKAALAAAQSAPPADQITRLNAVIDGFPNAEVVPAALMAKARTARAQGAHDVAYFALAALWNQHREQCSDLALVLRMLAEEAAAWGRPNLAVEWLARGRSMFRTTPLELENGQTTTFEKLSEQLLGAGGSAQGTLAAVPAKLPNRYVIRGPGLVAYEAVGDPPGSRDDLLVLYSQGRLHVLTAATGAAVIRPLELGEAPKALLAVLADRLVLQGNRSIVAVSLRTGQPEWTYRVTGNGGGGDPELAFTVQSAEVAGRQVIAAAGSKASGAGELFALDLASGQQAWRIPLRKLPERAVRFSGDRYLAFSINGETGCELVVVNVDRGEELHRLPLGRAGLPVAYGFSPDGKLVAVTDERVMGIDPERGEVLFSEAEPSTGIAQPGALALGVDAFFVVHNRGLARRSYENGAVQWATHAGTEPTGEGTVPRATVFLEGDVVYLAGFAQADAIDSQKGTSWRGLVPGDANFVDRVSTRDYLVVLNHKRPGRAGPVGEYELILYSKKGQMKCDARIPVGPLPNVQNLLVRDGAAVIQSADELTVLTSGTPVEKRVNLAP